MSSIKSARDTFTIPFLSLYLDLIKSKTSNQKFVALRVCFNALEKVNLGYNLVVRRFAPTTRERQECQLSAILTDWADGILKEFDIDILRDVLTSCSDSGSDVKCALDVLIDAWWEWCISHLSHLALTDAFGMSIDPAKSKNVVARKFFKKIKKVIEAINKSELLGGAFKAAMMEIFATYLKLINSPQHRWSATALVLERLLICWDAIILAFRDLQRPVPLTDSDHTSCIEFYSIIEPVCAVQIKAQAMQSFVMIDVYIMLYTLITTTLDLGKPLALLEPVCRQLGIEHAANVNVSRPTDLLQQPARDARALLLEAMSHRFFNRYHPIFALRKPEKVYGQAHGCPRLLKSALVASDLKFSYLLDAQSVLFPPMTSGMILKEMINAIRIDSNDVPIGWTIETLWQQHFDFIVQFIWCKISNLAEQVAAPIRRQANAQASDATPAPRSQPPAKRAKTVDVLSRALDMPDDEEERAADKRCNMTEMQTVAAEIVILKEIGSFNKAAWPDPNGLCSWWALKPQRTRMPCLGEVALAILANKPSSGGLECDLGTMSDVLAPKRSSLRAGLVEVNMFLIINKHLMPTNPDDVIMLGKEWEEKNSQTPCHASLRCGGGSRAGGGGGRCIE